MDLSKREIFKREIIIKATEVISKTGVDQITLRQIADHVGLKQTALLHHYSSKERIVHECILQIVNKNNNIVSRMLELNKNNSKISSYILGNIDWALDNRSEAGLILYLYYRASFDDSYRNLYEKIKESAQLKIQSFLKEDGCIDDNMTVTLIHEALIGGILHLIVNKKRITKKQISDLNTKIISFIFKKRP